MVHTTPMLAMHLPTTRKFSRWSAFSPKGIIANRNALEAVLANVLQSKIYNGKTKHKAMMVLRVGPICLILENHVNNWSLQSSCSAMFNFDQDVAD